MRSKFSSTSIVCCFMACMAGSLSFSLSNQATAQVTYAFSGIANNLGNGDGLSLQVGFDEPYTATFVVDESVVDSDPSPLRGEYAGAIISSSVKFLGGYSSMVDFTGGDVVVYKENPGGGIIFDAPGINDSGIVLFRDDGVPYESDSLIVDPQVVPMQTGFWALDEPDGLVVSFSDLSGPPVSLSITSAFVTTTLYGDVDLSGAVNFDDISAFIAVLASNGYQPEADFDDSGFVDFGDIPPFIEKLINL